MRLLMPLASLLGIEVEGAIDRLRAMAILYGFIALFAALGLGFLIAAGYIAVAAHLGSLNTALLFGGTALALALVLLVGARIGEGRRRRRRKERQKASQTGALLTTAAATALPALLRSPLFVRLGIPAAAIAAFALLHDSGQDDDAD